MRKYKCCFIIPLILVSVLLKAQENHYIVFFTDKDNSSYSISNPQEFLSSRAIERRTNQGIAIDEEDLPVNPGYVNAIKALGSVEVKYSLRWLNAIQIEASQTDAEDLKFLSFVSDVEFVAPSSASGRISKESEITEMALAQSDTLLQFDILGVPEMRLAGYQGEDMIISIMDGGYTGVPSMAAFQHLFDNNQILMTSDLLNQTEFVYDQTDHGTKVLSLLAAKNDTPEYQGIVPHANYLLFKTEDILSEYKIEEYRWMKAAELADSAGTDIILSTIVYNVFDDPAMDYKLSDLDGQTAVISVAAQKAADKGILVVNSAGNKDSYNPLGVVLFPADIKDGLAVGSLLTETVASSFSSKGPTIDGRIKPDVMAIGSNTYVIGETNQVELQSGTSYSAPLVAGLAAGVWQAFPEVSVLSLIDAFRNSSSMAANPNNEMGYGIPSYQALVNYLGQGSNEDWLLIYPNPVSGFEKVRIKVTDPISDSQLKLSIFDRMGRELSGDKLELSWQNNEYVLEVSTLPRGIYILNLQSKSNFSRVKILKL